MEEGVSFQIRPCFHAGGAGKGQGQGAAKPVCQDKVPVPAPWLGNRPLQPGVGDGHHLHTHEKGLHVPCSHHRGVQPVYRRMGHQQHDGYGVVHGDCTGGVPQTWAA